MYFLAINISLVVGRRKMLVADLFKKYDKKYFNLTQAFANFFGLDVYVLYLQ